MICPADAMSAIGLNRSPHHSDKRISRLRPADAAQRREPRSIPADVVPRRFCSGGIFEATGRLGKTESEFRKWSTTRMSHMKSISRFGLPALCGGVLVALLGVVPGPARPVQAAFVEQGKGGPQLLIGRDDDNIGNVDIQAGAGANQSLDRTDIIEGGSGNDVIFGLNGNDVIDGGPGQDIILGGPDGGAAPGGPRTATPCSADRATM